MDEALIIGVTSTFHLQLSSSMRAYMYECSERRARRVGNFHEHVGCLPPGIPQRTSQLTYIF